VPAATRARAQRNDTVRLVTRRPRFTRSVPPPARLAVSRTRTFLAAPTDSIRKRSVVGAPPKTTLRGEALKRRMTGGMRNGRP